MALFSYPVCTWLCQYVNMGVRKWLEKSAEKQKYKMRKTANPLSRKAFRAVSFSATKDTSPWSTSSKGRFSLFFGVEFDSYYKYFFTFPQRFISSPNPQLLHTPALQFEHISDCCFRNLAKLSDSHASRKVCCFKSTEKVSSSIPKEQGNAIHLELMYIENLAASQNSMDSIAMLDANLYIAGDWQVSNPYLQLLSADATKRSNSR